MHSLIRGSPKERYILLLSYYYMLKLKNLRIITRVKADDNNKFKFFYGSWHINKGFFLQAKSNWFGWYLFEVYIQGNLVGGNMSGW